MQTPVATLIPPLKRRHILIFLGAVLVTAISGRVLPVAAQNSPPLGSEIMDAQSAYDAARSGEIILVDIRRPDEWAETGIGEGAVALDMREESFVTSMISLRRAFPDTPIALICRTGNRSGRVVSALAAQNFSGLVDVSEGMVGGPNGQGWIARGLPVYFGTKNEIQERLNTVITR